MREEIRLLSDAVDRDERLAFVGASGSGKTSVIRELLNARWGKPQRVICYDPMRELRAAECRTMAQAKSVLAGAYGRVRICEKALFSDLIYLALKAGNCLIVADEAQQLFPADGRATECSAALLEAVTTGRHYRCPLLWATQSPGRCSYTLTDNSTGARVVGSLSSPSSLSRVADWGLERREVASLPPHQLLLSIPAQPVRRFRSVKM